MGFKLNLGMLCVGVNLCSPMIAHALMISPVKIDSSQGEPLYAEIPFSNAQPESTLQVSVAQDGDIAEFGGNQAANSGAMFNTFIRQNPQGNGVIVITSNRPVQSTELNLVLKINDNGQTRIQQINASLPSRIDRLKSQLDDTTSQPKQIANKDATINLPIVTDNSPNNSEEKPLILNNQQPPAVNGATLVNDTPVADPYNNAQVIQLATVITNSPPTVTQNNAPTNQQTVTVNNDKVNKKPQDQVVAPTGSEETTTAEHVVQNKESLWSISTRIAEARHLNVNQVMKSIQSANPKAFVNGNPNKLRQGTVLTLPEQYQVVAPKTPKDSAQPNHQKPTVNVKTHHNQQNQTTTKNMATKVQNNSKKHQPAVTPKLEVIQPPLSQAHMTVVGSSKHGNSQDGNKLSATESKALQTLVTQIQTQRTFTLNLQSQVRQLDQTVHSKAQRIQVLDSRIAELQKQLENQQKAPPQAKKQK